MSFLDKLQEAMRDRGWTTYRLAKESGMSYHTVRRTMRGLGGRASRRKVAEVLCIEVEGTPESGYWLVEERKRLGVTQRELAKKTRLSASHLSGIEVGLYNPSENTLARIKWALEAIRREKEGAE